jgi:hypothetical protein
MPSCSNIAEPVVSFKGIPGTKEEPQTDTCHILVEFIEYISNDDVTRTVIKKFSGNISVTPLNAADQLLIERSLPDVFSRIIDGKADLVIDNISRIIHSCDGTGSAVYTASQIAPIGRMKMIISIIKGGA